MLAVIKIGAQLKRAEPRDQGNALMYDFEANVADSIRIVAHVGEICFRKNDPWPPQFCPPDVLVAWQQPASKLENLRRVNNGCKLKGSWEPWETQDDHLVLMGSLAIPIFWLLCAFVQHGAQKLFLSPETSEPLEAT